MRIAVTLAAVAWLAAPALAGVGDVKITTDRTVDTSSLAAVIKGLKLDELKSNDRKAIRVFEFARQMLYHHRCPKEAYAAVGPVKAINVYGWSLCGSLHTILIALYEEVGWPARYRGWRGHMTMEVKYDGRWHYFDIFLDCYYWTRDKKTIAGQDNIIADPDIVLKAVEEGRTPTPYLCCGDSAAGVVSGVKGSRPWDRATGRKPPASGVTMVGGTARVHGVDHPSAARIALTDGPAYSTAMPMLSGMRMKLMWATVENGQFGINGKKTKPRHTCGIKDFRRDPKLGPILMPYGQRTWANGDLVYSPDFTKAACWADLTIKENVTVRNGAVVPAVAGKPAYVGALIRSPYVCSLAKAAAEWSAPAAANTLEVSLDGKTWTKVTPSAAARTPPTAAMTGAWLKPGEQDLTMGRYDKAGVLGRYGFYVRAGIATGLKKLTVRELLVHNRCALPYLLPGANEITVALADPKVLTTSRLFVTYVYAEGTRKPDARPRHPFDGSGYQWGADKTVRREITRTPFRFTITVAGDTPPRMKSLTRELLPK